MNAKGFRDVLLSEKVPYQRNRAVAAILAEESGLGTEGLTVVGGSALEIYTTGDYVSKDIDLLAENRERIVVALRSLGFREEGRYWRHPDLPPSVQIVGQYDSGSRARNRIVLTPYGRLRLGAIEDIVWKRVVEARYWNRPEALVEAKLAVRRYGDRIDWEYVERQGREQHVEDLVADLRAATSSGKRADPKNLRRE